MTYQIQLLERLRNKISRVGIVGLGYVGLPLAIEFARAGLTVIGVDVDAQKVARLQAGESYIGDVPAADVQRYVGLGQLRVSTNYTTLHEADTVSVCVPTPLNANHEPDMSFVSQVAAQLAPAYHPGLIIALESTVYPGATEDVFAPALAAAGLRLGEDAFLVFSPERIDPGNHHFGVRNTPKVIGGVTPACLEVAQALYTHACDHLVPVSSIRAAETVKLLENTFRFVNIGLVNELALMCDRMNVNVWEVIDAAATKPYGFMKFIPGPGIGGHCIPIDPLYLSWKMKSLGYIPRFIETADVINLHMPEHVVGLVIRALNDEGRALKNASVLVVGIAYKKDIDDLRESPALEIIAQLRRWGARVQYHDPHAPRMRLPEGGYLESTPLTPEALQAAEAVIIITDHTAIDWNLIRREARLVIDTRNALKQATGPARVVVL